MFRSRVPTLDDPLLKTYLEQLTFKLATYSELNDRRLELIVINNPTMNAFAVPGGVVGTHTGLFQFAQSEDQLASVLAHELGHLSQRHFARGVANRRANSLTSMAGLLAGLILAATVGGDAGMAAMTASQAAAMDKNLRFSRQNEQEADRIGIATLYRGGMDPAAVAAMFDRMLAATRYTGHHPPEFLLTHPLTEKRISDARGRLGKYPKKFYKDNVEYHLMRARALMAIDNNPQHSLKRFQSELDGHSKSSAGARYGLSLALSALGRQEEARTALQALLTEDPERLTYQLTAIAIDRADDNYSAAHQRIASLLPNYSNNYPLQVELSETLLAENRYGESELILEKLSRQRPTDPDIWYQLAETSGLAGDIPGVHVARAEYFILTGIYDKARQQLGYAQKLVARDFKRSAIIRQRLKDLNELESKSRKL
ncbi:MAG: M48 family metalloprotease [Porticoccaceae bacterium]|nr:M48 family metalloprotease [Porticoccaceae bacterium]